MREGSFPCGLGLLSGTKFDTDKLTRTQPHTTPAHRSVPNRRGPRCSSPAGDWGPAENAPAAMSLSATASVQNGARGFGSRDYVADSLLGDVSKQMAELEWRCFQALSGEPDALTRALTLPMPGSGGRLGDDHGGPHAIFNLTASQRSSAATEPGEEGPAPTPAHRLLAPQTTPAAGVCGEVEACPGEAGSRSLSIDVGHTSEGTPADPARPPGLPVDEHSRKIVKHRTSMESQLALLEQEDNIARGKTKNAGRDWNFFAKFETPRSVSFDASAGRRAMALADSQKTLPGSGSQKSLVDNGSGSQKSLRGLGKAPKGPG